MYSDHGKCIHEQHRLDYKSDNHRLHRDLVLRAFCTLHTKRVSHNVVPKEM